MLDKLESTVKMARHLANNDEHMSAGELADHLNRNGYKTNSGKEYKGGRGTSRMISSIYDRLKEEGRDEDAKNVALSYTNKNDKHSWGTPSEKEGWWTKLFGK